MTFSTIIIPTYNNADLTVKCVNSVVKHTPLEVEIIVVDDHSEPRDLKRLLARLPRPMYRRLDVCSSVANTGFGRACNSGAEIAGRKSDVVVFLNNDVVVGDSWYKGLVDGITIDKIGICGSKLLYPESKFSAIHNREVRRNTIQHAGIGIGDDGIPVHVYQFEKGSMPEANIRKTYPFVTGASMAVRREVFEAIEGFDSKFTNGCEDLDLCLKARDIGFQVLYCPDSIGHHHETATRSPESSQTNLDILMIDKRGYLERDRNFESKEL